MLRTRPILIAILLLPFLLVGCSPLKVPKIEPTKSRLAALKPESKQIVLDVIFVRLSPREATTIESIWQEVDEQAIPSETRLRLLRNGFRVGLLGHSLPSSVSSLLSTTDSPTANGRSIDPSQRLQPGITRHQLYLRPAHRAELVASPTQAEFHALVWSDRGAEGNTYTEAQAQFSVQAEPGRDGRTELRMIPEVHHGSQQQHYAGGNAMFRLDSRRRRESFDDLAVMASLAPGEVLVMGRRADHAGTLGDRFFGSTNPALVAERLLLIRLSKKAADPLFGSLVESLTGDSASEASESGE